MTSVAATLERPPTRVGTGAEAATRRVRAADVAVVLALVWWATSLTWGSGGRDPHVLSVEAVLLAVALVLARPWQKLPRVALVAAGTLALAPWVVVLAAPTGWKGANDAASYSTAVAIFAVVAAWARGRNRRLIVLGVVLTACGAEFEKAFLPWWGYGARSPEMWGTFYWYNEFAAFLIPGVVLAAGLAAVPRSPLRHLAWVAGPLSLAGIYFSTSRGGEAATVVAVALCCVVAWRALAWSGVRRVLLVLGVGVGVAALLSSPLLFPHGASLTAGNAERAATFAGDSASRLGYWHHAVQVWAHWPIVGAGFHSFASATGIAAGRGAGNTAFAHDSWLQAFADGGVVLGVPFLVASGLLVLAACRSVVLGVRRRVELEVASVAIALLGVLAHSAIDFDLTYAALFGLVGVLGGLVVADQQDRSGRELRVGRPVGVTFLLVVLAALALACVGAWHGNWHFNVPVVAR